MKYQSIVDELNKIEVNHISKNELYNLYFKLYNNNNSKTFDNLIVLLKSYNAIMDYTENEYMILNKNTSKYNLSENNYSNKNIKDISKLISNNYSEIKYVIWDTNIINEFTHHYAVNNYIIIEAEKYAIEPILYLLKENLSKKYNIMTEEMFNQNREYILNDENVIILKNLIQKAPLEKNDNNEHELTLEKIIVDLLKDKLYIQYQGKELESIYKNIFEKYNINLKRLYSYAKNRGILEELKEILYKTQLIEKV